MRKVFSLSAAIKYALITVLTCSLFFLPTGKTYAQGLFFDPDYTTFETQPFMLQELNGFLDFGFLYEDDKDYSEGGGRQRKHSRFEESLNLFGRASVYHPNLLEIEFDTKLGFYQSSYTGDNSRSEQGSPNEYDVRISLLKEKPLNARLFASQQDYDISRQFLDSLNVQQESSGAHVNYFGGSYALYFKMQTLESEEDASDYRRERSEDSANFGFQTFTGGALETDFKFDHREITDRSIPGRSLPDASTGIPSRNDYDDIVLTNTLHYGNIRGTSNISYYKISGDFESDTLLVTENLGINHSDTLQTFLNYNFSKYESGESGFTSITNNGIIGVHHQLYESLRTKLSLELNRTDDDDYLEEYYEPKLNLAYNKKVPFGQFFAVYNTYWRRTTSESNNSEEDGRQVVNEPHVLITGVTTYLDNTYVILESVVVRDENGILLVEDVDYELIQSGILTEIRRVNLPNGSRVLVDYRYLAPSDLEYDTVGNVLDLRYDLTAFVSLFYNNFSSVNKNVTGDSSDLTSGTLADRKRETYGVELRWKWFDFTTQYEDDSSDINPYEAWRAFGNFRTNVNNFSFLTISANRSEVDYEDERGTEEFNSAFAALNTVFTHNINAQFSLEYLRDDGYSRDEEMWKFNFDLFARFRQLDLEFTGEYFDRQESKSGREELRLELRIIRHFSVL